MIRVTTGSKMLLLRYKNYKKKDFVCEHKKLLQEHGHVWILKTGKRLPTEKLSEVFGNEGVLLLRAPKSVGGQYYAAHVVEHHSGGPTNNMIYPDYYDDMVCDESLWMIDSLDGTWFKIDTIEQVDEKSIKHIYLISNNKRAEDVISKTRSATMYVYSDMDFSTLDIQ